MYARFGSNEADAEGVPVCQVIVLLEHFRLLAQAGCARLLPVVRLSGDILDSESLGHDDGRIGLMPNNDRHSKMMSLRIYVEDAATSNVENSVRQY